MSEELKKLIEDQKKAIVAYQDAVKDELSGKIGAVEVKAIETKIDQKLSEINAAIAKLQAPQAGGEQKSEPAHKMFWKGFRKSILGQSLTPEEQKTMTVGDPTTGGYLAPAEFVNDMIKIDVLYSPIRSIAKTRTTSAKSIQVPAKTSSASASWVTEIGTRSETTNPKFGLEEIPTHEMYALAKVSKQDLEDVNYDLEGFLKAEFAEQFGVLEGTAFVSGNAVGKPEGVLTKAGTGYTGVTTSAKIVAADLKRVFYALNEKYAANSTWIWNRSSTLAIAGLTNSVSGDFLWQPGLQAGTPANVLGRPYVECTDMPAEGSSAKAVVIGDFRAGYLIVDRVAMDIMVDPYTSKATGCVEISARKRVGGQVVLAEALKIYVLQA